MLLSQGNSLFAGGFMQTIPLFPIPDMFQITFARKPHPKPLSPNRIGRTQVAASWQFNQSTKLRILFKVLPKGLAFFKLYAKTKKIMSTF